MTFNSMIKILNQVQQDIVVSAARSRDDISLRLNQF